MAMSNGVVLADTGFWIALFCKRDAHHQTAKGLSATVLDNVYMPWPLMYEALNTRMVKNPNFVSGFARHAFATDRRIDDTKYRDECVRRTIDDSKRRPMSLVDRVVRAIIDDSDMQIGTLLTFNDGDFVDVCRIRGVEMWPAMDPKVRVSSRPLR
jgi:predicted nucleic acid-binding protein